MMDIVDLLLGKPLATEDEKAERIGAVKGIPIFGLDALSSAAYGPEAALTLLIPLGMAGVAYILPITAAIVILLTIVYFSYRQTMQAYPYGGGSYTVASENLGTGAGLLAAAALMIDYVLTAAVGISAGVGALVSAVPSLQPHTLAMCLGILLVLAIVNLRGVRETGGIFMIPTYLFIACLLGMIVIGVAKAFLAGGHPIPVVAPPKLTGATEAMGVWLMLRAFSSGCTAMTGVEAVSNGVMAFREPTYKYAQKTLTIIIGILMIMLLGIAYLCPIYGVAATNPEGSGYQSVLSQLLGAITGKGAFYWVSIASILLVLSLSANTAFADFPRLAHAIARNGFLPQSLTLRGRRLVFSQGVYALSILAGLLLTIFGGVTDRLIPLYAVGAFLAFTLSQAGMVVHWRKTGGPGARRSMFVNGLGAVATAITVAVVLIAKFVEGAWIVVVLIPMMILTMRAVKHHYARVERQTAAKGPINTAKSGDPIVVVPVEHWSIVSENALRFAWQISSDIRILHVECGEETDALCRKYSEYIEGPAKAAGLPVPELVLLKSPFRFIVRPILNYTLELEQANPDRTIAVIIPELVESRWYYVLLHNNRSQVLKAMLNFSANRCTVIINMPWRLPD
ncbi:MAG TPA: APC family permease [Bryobacteraceae bacterium]|jgi:amino acid transporter|nr:APC family permease [Bryobacteraceae bacterium]